MTIHASVKNFLGLQSAEIDIDSVVLVSGRNYQGKSSFLKGVGAALTGMACPPAIHKKDAEMLVNDSADYAKVEITGSEGSSYVTWPSCEVTSQGKPPRASAFAVGLLSYPDLDSATRATTLINYLKADPTAEDLKAAFIKAEVQIKSLESIWGLIKKDGWDGAWKRAKEEAVSGKRAWEKLTGDRYGSSKAPQWTPAGWTVELARHSENELLTVLEDRKKRVEDALAAAGADQAKIDELKKQADQLPEFTKRLSALIKNIADLAAQDQKLQERLAALPTVPNQEGATVCPCCGKGVVVKVIGAGKYRLDKIEEVDDLESLRREKDINDATTVVAETRSILHRLQGEKPTLEGAIENAKKAKAEHDKLMAKEAKGKATETPEAAKAALSKAESDLAMKKKKIEADDTHYEIARMEAIAPILAPEGVRKQKLQESLVEFNKALKEKICDIAEWPTVAVNEDLNLTISGRPYSILISESEKWRCRVVMQIAMAEMDPSDMLIIDGVEILDGPARNGLLDLLADVGIPTILGMTEAKPQNVPDLAKHGLGMSLWVEGGVAKPLGECAKEAA